MKTIPVGYVVSSATLRHSDLIQSYVEFMETFEVRSPLINEGKKFLEKHPDFGYAGYLSEEDGEEVCWWLEDACDVLNEVAPENTYFGTHEGDGSLFGFWEITED